MCIGNNKGSSQRRWVGTNGSRKLKLSDPWKIDNHNPKESETLLQNRGP